MFLGIGRQPEAFQSEADLKTGLSFTLQASLNDSSDATFDHVLVDP